MSTVHLSVIDKSEHKYVKKNFDLKPFSMFRFNFKEDKNAWQNLFIVTALLLHQQKNYLQKKDQTVRPSTENFSRLDEEEAVSGEKERGRQGWGLILGQGWKIDKPCQLAEF